MTAATQERTRRVMMAPLDETGVRNAAVAAIIRAALMRFGSIDVSVWEGEAVAVRCQHFIKPNEPPIKLPTDEQVLSDLRVGSAARVLSGLQNRKRGVFRIQVQDGRFNGMMVYDGLSDTPSQVT